MPLKFFQLRGIVLPMICLPCLPLLGILVDGWCVAAENAAHKVAKEEEKSTDCCSHCLLAPERGEREDCLFL